MPVVGYRDRVPIVPASAYVAEGACLIGAVSLGHEASVWFNAVLRGDINSIEIGDRTNVQDGAVFHVTEARNVRVGREVTVGHRAIVHGCTISGRTLIGMGSIILDGARIEENVVVAAGAVVLENAVIPAGSLAVGVPARVVRKLTDDEIRGIALSAEHYVHYARMALQSNQTVRGE